MFPGRHVAREKIGATSDEILSFSELSRATNVAREKFVARSKFSCSGRDDAMTSRMYEADARARDPPMGCSREVHYLIQEIGKAEDELKYVKRLQKLYERPTDECILAPYFPKGQEKQYKNAHALYGFKNMKKMLEAIPDASSQKDCVTSLKYEADALAQDPSKGCCQEVDDLLQQLQMANDQLQEVKQKLYERPADR
ncbi:LOB domain-containing protein 27 [Tanacetum coccineum]